MRNPLNCGTHGATEWKGHVVCDACGRVYQTTDDGDPGYAPEICRCGKRLMPNIGERAVGGGDGGDFTGRPVCVGCAREKACTCPATVDRRYSLILWLGSICDACGGAGRVGKSDG